MLATDNTTVESCFYKGNSASEKLFELIIRMRTIELKHSIRLMITRVSGKRMIAQGTDGVSRGRLNEGVSLGDTMTKYCPWGLTPLNRQAHLGKWFNSIIGNHLEILTPQQWYTRGHDHDGYEMHQDGLVRPNISSGTNLWEVAPIAAPTAVEELRISRLKRRKSTHLFIVPKLFTHLWLKQLQKACDVVLYIQAGSDGWSEDQHEPLTLGICFPYIKYRPWKLRRSPKMLRTGRGVQRVIKEDKMASRAILLELFTFGERVQSMSSGMVRKLLYFEGGSQVSCGASYKSVMRHNQARRD